ncbi:MAG: UDP-4-amino-4,6-dideoxy-N-acetyl-beta-L-altrosamine transaminase [Deltaproteobacteria bacterium]|nr:UDP-4-amino-4,6-dideoxy-N-acetyl-beta-L-altrosamine transaminase [Deltaproteobacteria bacterium]MBZ0219247.1 UDP-4-amino-4,6-dideoxy-N-acetyl-beta-L-altrosamine transaminase [Deltaproteobacteria bacterium]
MEKTAISYGRQTIDLSDIEAVTRSLEGMLTQGPLVEAFEAEIAGYTGAKYAVVCSNGTAALHLAMKAAGLGEGHKAVTSPITFLASANAALYAGARPDFADIEADGMNIDPESVRIKAEKDRAVKAVIPVHFAGVPCRMEEIRETALKHGLTVIEDACHALGAEWTDSNGQVRRVGSCSHSDMTVFSFHPVKSITTGEGGAVTTNDPAIYEKLKTLRSHGVVKEPARLSKAEGPWYYEMQDLGFNYRLPDINCALGISQIKKLDRFVERRAGIAALYERLFSKYTFMKPPNVPAGARSAWHLYPARIPFDELGVERKDLFRLMSEIGIGLQVHYIPVHTQPYYMSMGFKPGDFPRALRFYAEEVSLPIYPLLSDEEAGAVAEGLLSSLACLSVQAKRPVAV